VIASNVLPSKPPVQQLQLGWIDRCARSFLFGLLGKIQGGTITVVGDGWQRFGSAGAPDSPRITIEVSDARFYRTVAAGGSIAAGEAYLRGYWNCDDLTGLIRLLLRNRAALESLEGLAGRWRQPLHRLWHRWRGNSRHGSRENIAAHYDLGNDFFALFLDETLSYSCGVFADPQVTLAEASIEKNDRVCRKLRLSADDHVLEIGSGWGGFALHAASRYGCRVTTATISRAQFEVVSQRVHAARLQRRVTVVLEDYRQLRGQYDKLVSIEMIEAVGYQYLPTFFRCCQRLLKPSGLMLLQAILMSDNNFDAYRGSVDFIQRYIFPGGFLPSLGSICQAMAQDTELGLVQLEDITAHYPRTLRAWRNRFTQRREELTSLDYPATFQRMWHFYFCYCEAAFLERHVTCAQLLLAGPRGNLSEASV
jgi:cyclopropane-fatty-acyl-phospholipid synthase